MRRHTELSLPGILASIVDTKRAELEALRSRARSLEAAATAAPPVREWAAALRRPERVAVIAEFKRRSPGAGDIRPDLDPGELARAYERGGAVALSVLTDATYFGGSTPDLGAARAATSLPVLRKDFTLDPLHLLEARAGSADAVLLIVRILDDRMLGSLLEEARALGMAALVETHDLTEVRRAVDAGASVVGINNRDLVTFTAELDTTLGLIEHVPDDVTIVSESGIRARADVDRLGAAGVHAVLVGESLLRSHDPAEAVAALADVGRRPRA